MTTPTPVPRADSEQAGSLTDPRWIPGIPFTARLQPPSTFTFEASASETQCVLELSPEELSRMLTERDLPLVDENADALWESVRHSAEDLTPWRREIHIRGVRSGRDIWVRVHAVPRHETDGSILWTGLLVEVTDLKTAQDRLWTAYQQLSSHMDNTPLAVIEWDAEGRVLRWSRQAERVFGWTATEVVGRKLAEFPLIHPEDAERIGALMEAMVQKRTLRSQAINRNFTNDGRTLYCEWYNSVVFDDHGGLTVLSFGLDVTERRHAEELLARNANLLRTALDAAKMLVWDWDLLQQRLHYSADFAEFFGVPSGPDYGSYVHAPQAIHPEIRDTITAAYATFLQREGSFRYEFRGAACAPDGGDRWFDCRGQVTHDAGQPVRVVAVTFDITERKRAEQEKATFDHQLQDAQKLETLGVLAGGIAHDFNNLLTVVLGNASLSRKAVGGDSPVQDYLDQIETACQRAAGLCRQMLAYAGRGQVVFERVFLNQVIRDSAELLRVSAEGRARIDYNLPEPLPAVKVDLPQLRQVLLNLVMNAAEAVLPETGRVFVRSGLMDVKEGDNPTAFQTPPTPGRYVFLDVADNGPGMIDAVRERIFDPFFTTKFAGRGLGLPAVLGIVRAHRGAIRIDTTPGRGTLVRVLWPTAPGEAPMIPQPPIIAAPPSRPLASARPRESGVALIVDDEIFVREVAASSLEEIGFETLVADGGAAALELYQAHRSRLRVAVIDLIMPVMNGGELIEKLRGFDPAFPIVLISGFTDRGLPGPPPGSGPILFLRKPFRPEELMAAVQEVLQPTAPPSAPPT